MKKKYLLYGLMPVMALTLAGAGTAFAHGGFGGGFGFGMMPKATPEQIVERQQTLFQDQATLLGVSVDDVKAAWAKGQTLQELATAKGITQDQLKQKMADSRKVQMQSMLKTLVDKGVVTQAQADQRLQFMQTVQTKKGNGPRGFGHRGWF